MWISLRMPNNFFVKLIESYYDNKSAFFMKKVNATLFIKRLNSFLDETKKELKMYISCVLTELV